MAIHLYLKPIYSHFRGQTIKTPKSYLLFINSHKASEHKMGETVELHLPAGKNSLQVKISPVPEYFPSYARLLNVFPRAKSNSIAIKINADNVAESVYFVCEDTGTSMSDDLKRWGIWLLWLVQFKQKPHVLSLDKVSKEVFYKEKEEKKPKETHWLQKTPSMKRLLGSVIIVDILMVLFSIYLFNQSPSGIVSGMAIALFLSLTGLGTSWYYFYKSSVVSPHYYKTLRFKGVLYGIVFAIIAYNTINDTLVYGISILFLCFYIFIFFNTKRVFREQKT